VDTIDLNCDLGESFGAYRIGLDDEVIPLITSANIACGWHAGDPLVMDRTIRLAREAGIGIGAHPGYPDLMGFGRRSMACSLEEVRAYIIYQVGALKAFCAANGVRLNHVKPHGALYNNAVGDADLTRAIAEAVASVDDSLLLVVLAGADNAEKKAIGEKAGIRVVCEAFPDRAYTPEGTLQPRGCEGAVLADPREVARRALAMAGEGRVTAVDGTTVNLAPDTLCVHGDSPAALELVTTIRGRLADGGIALETMS
jgi:UPF0271 protein